jgi:hypothetical protein
LLTETRPQRIEDRTIIVMPAKWSKATVKTLFDIMGSAAMGRWAPGAEEPEPDFSKPSLDEWRQLKSLLDRVDVRPPEGRRY